MKTQQLGTIFVLTLEEKQKRYSRKTDVDSADSDWERFVFDALEKIDK